MQKLINPFLIISIATLLRLLPHPANIAPIGALALFGGAYLNKKYAIVVPLLAMFLSDIVLGFHDTILFVYGSFVIAGFIGIWLRNHMSFQTIIAATLASSLLFYLITNFGVWVVGSLYPKTVSGLLESYINAIPFLRNTLLGDLFYVGVIFGSYEAAVRLIGNTDNAKIKSRSF